MEALQERSVVRREAKTACPEKAGRLRRFLHDRRAASVVEFALMTPIFLSVLGAAIDFGMAVRIKFKLSSALDTATNYALVNASSANSTSGATLASSLATLIASANATNWASSSVTVNNGPTASVTAGSATVTSSGTATNADSLYCPTGSGTNLTWGSQNPSTCANSSIPGKFVLLSAKANYTPMILPISLFGNLPTVTSTGSNPVSSVVLSASSVVQVQ